MKLQNIFTTFKGMAIAVLLTSLFSTACTWVDEPVPIPDPTPATYTINGEVYNNNTGLPIAGVAVKLGTLTATTDNAGKFQFANLSSAGKYTIELTKTGFMPVTVALEFPAGKPNEAHIFTVSCMMVPYVPGGTFVSPVTGSTIFIPGGLQNSTLTISPNTVAKDETGATIKTPFQMIAVQVNNQLVGTPQYPAMKVFSFGLNGYSFTPALVLKIESGLTNYHYSNLFFQYFTNNAWGTLPEAIVYNLAQNNYSTSISHFSMFKAAFNEPIVAGTSAQKAIKVYDSLKINRGLASANWSNWKYQKNDGYTFSQPLETTLTNLGFTGSNQTELIASIIDIVTYNNNGIAPLNAFAKSDATKVELRTIPSMTYLLVTGKQNFSTQTYTLKVKLNNLPGTAEKTIIFSTLHAGSVELTFDPKPYDEHAHIKYHGHDGGLGGGGSL